MLLRASFKCVNLKYVCRRGSVLDPAGGGYSAPPDLLGGFGGEGKEREEEGRGKEVKEKV